MSEKRSAGGGPAAVDCRVQVAYMVPVEVVVDLGTGKVDRAVVIDESIALDADQGARQETTLRPIPAAVASRATSIAEDGDWPAWEHGF